MRNLVLSAAFAMAFAAPAFAQDAKPEDTLVMQTKGGDVRIALDVENAPNHAERLKTLANQGFYDGLKFHRVIPGFMAQTGDPRGDGTGGSELPDLGAEFHDAPFERGTVGMARSGNPNSANSQFFIMFDRAAHLDGQYTVVGEVVEGMEAVDALKKGSIAANGAVEDPDTITKMRTADELGS